MEFSMQVTSKRDNLRPSTTTVEEIICKALSCKVQVKEEKYTSNSFVVTVEGCMWDRDTAKQKILDKFKSDGKYNCWFIQE